MTGKFKYTEAEFERITFAIYRLMTARASAIVDLWPAFKSAQSTVNPVQKYSVNFPNTRVMKELKRRVDALFAEMAKKPAEPKEVIIKDEALAKADAIFAKLGIRGGAKVPLTAELFNENLAARVTQTGREIIAKAGRIISDKGTDLDSCYGFDPKQSRQVKLLTGNTVEREDETRVITIVTNCPKKFVIVDLETGEQWSSNGIPNHRLSSNSLQAAKIKATRKVAIPKPKGKA